MAEELRIIVVDEGGELPSGAVDMVPSGAAPGVPADAVTSAPAVERDRPKDERGAPAATPKTSAATGAVSGAAARAAAGDLSGALSGLAGAAANIGALGAAAATATAGITIATAAARTWGKIVDREAAKLARFSGAVTSAQVERGFERRQALLRRADRIGGEVAKAQRIQTRFESQLANLNTEITKSFLAATTAIAEPVTTLAGFGIDQITKLLSTNVGQAVAQQTLLQGLLGGNGPLATILLEVSKLIGQQEGDEDPILAWLMAQGGGSADAGVSALKPGFIGDIPLLPMGGSGVLTPATPFGITWPGNAIGGGF